MLNMSLVKHSVTYITKALNHRRMKDINKYSSKCHRTYRALFFNRLYTSWTIIEYTTGAVCFLLFVWRDRITHVCVVSHAWRILGTEVYQVSLDTQTHTYRFLSGCEEVENRTFQLVEPRNFPQPRNTTPIHKFYLSTTKILEYMPTQCLPTRLPHGRTVR